MTSDIQNIQRKIQEWYKTETGKKYKNSSTQELLFALEQNNVLTPAEINSLRTHSLFSFGKKVELSEALPLEGWSIEREAQKPQMKQDNSETSKALEQRLNMVKADLDAKVKENRFLRSLWHGVKNAVGFGANSKKVEKALEIERKKISQINNPEVFKELTGIEYTKDNYEKFIRGEVKLKSEQALEAYKQGQDGVVDFAADMVSGVAAMFIYSAAVAAAPFTGGLSVAAGFGAAVVAGAAIKTGLKAGANALSGKKYTKEDLKHDAITGGVSGALGPFTGGVGGAFGKSVATKLGIQAVKEGVKDIAVSGAKQSVKQWLKTAFTNPAGYKYVGGNFAKRAAAFGAEAMTDGALGGALDGGFRAGLENDWDGGAILSGTVEGGAGGAVMAPAIGGGMKLFGKAGHSLGARIKKFFGWGKGTKQVCEILAEEVHEQSAKTSDKSITGDTFRRTAQALSDAEKIELANFKKNMLDIVDKRYAWGPIFSEVHRTKRKYKKLFSNDEFCLLYKSIYEKIKDYYKGWDSPEKSFFSDFDQRGLNWIKLSDLPAIEKVFSNFKNKDLDVYSVDYPYGFLEFFSSVKNDNYLLKLETYNEFNNFRLSSYIDDERCYQVIKEMKNYDFWNQEDYLHVAQNLHYVNISSDATENYIDFVIKNKDNENLAIDAHLFSDIRKQKDVDFIKTITLDGNQEQVMDGLIQKELQDMYFKLRKIDYIPKEDLGKFIDRQNMHFTYGAYDNKKWMKYLFKTIDFIYKDPEIPKEARYELVNIIYDIRDNKIIPNDLKVLLKEKKCTIEELKDIFLTYGLRDYDFAVHLCKNTDIPREHIGKLASAVTKDNKDYVIKLCSEYKKMEIAPNEILFLAENYNTISLSQLKKVNKILGKEAVSKLTTEDLKIACQFIDVKGVTNINEMQAHAKKDFLKALVACNEGLFNISDDMKKAFPIIPTNREDYCSLLPAIVRSLGIETNILNPEQIVRFNHSMNGLSETLAKISDKDFASLHITQEYTREEFIQTTLQKLKRLSELERQKVFDYFGFELHTYKVKTDKLDPKGKHIYEKHYTITGYPVNLNNGHKLAQITNPETQSVVESLRGDVIRFSENNRIKCENPQIETFLNDIVEALPELHSTVGRIQHGTHAYDVLQHSLKVMQKISQDPQFEKLNESDKKIMLLASLMHDITKKEGSSDVMHAANGSFDTFFIAKKFNLTKEEEIKLYTLIKHHEWLSYANSSNVTSEEALTKRLQSVAYDLRHDNMFDLALMFTHADLRAVKTDDSFHNSKIGRGRVNFMGETRSFGESADFYAKRIRKYIVELKKSQPILPVTKMPRASKIKQAITHVNPDGSTNLKGVYQDKDGLIIIRYNEVEDWEALGLPKGTKSKGIKAGGIDENNKRCIVDTGNIHFFVHGLDWVNQLIKFDAFGMIDSEVLLSLSYTERPESKFRFFRTQGVLLDYPTKYIHAGGYKDSGSGTAKFISEIKKNYIFGGEREKERTYISDLVKEATDMNDYEYIQFVKKYENKAFTDIEPESLRNKIIQIFAEINSGLRKHGERSYNEMYGSNPSDVMGVFGYPENLDGKIGDNIFDFVKSNDKLNGFLRQYALERDIPMYIFGY